MLLPLSHPLVVAAGSDIASSSISFSPSFRLTPTTRTDGEISCCAPHSTAHTSWLSWSMKIDLCDATDSFRTTLSKDHAYSEDGGCLTHATTVNS